MSDRVSNTRNDVQGFIAAREIDRKDTVRVSEARKPHGAFYCTHHCRAAILPAAPNL